MRLEVKTLADLFPSNGITSKFIQVSQANNFLLVNYDTSQGLVLCRPTKNVRQIIKRCWDIILGPAQDEAAENTFINKKCKHTFVFLPKNKDEI